MILCDICLPPFDLLHIVLDSSHCFTQEAVGDRRVKDDSAGSIGLVRTGVRMAALRDRGGGAGELIGAK